MHYIDILTFYCNISLLKMYLIVSIWTFFLKFSLFCLVIMFLN